MLHKKITKIVKKNNKKVHIYIDDEYSFTCFDNDIEQLNLYINRIIDNKELHDIENYLYKKKTLNYLYNLLSKRNYTESQLRKKLYKRQIPETIINDLIEYLKDNGILDEEKYFKELIHSFIEKKRYSLQEIKKKLFSRGFRRDLIDSIENYISSDNTLQTLESLIKKSKRDKNATIKYCIRKGFSYEDIIKVIKKLNKEE